MNIYKLLIITSILTYCCNPEVAPPKQLDCVLKEPITSQDTSFDIFSPGKSDYGYAKAIKLTKEWSASAVALFYKDTFYITLSTFWEVPNEPQWEYDTELLTFQVSNLIEPCLKLSRLTTNNSCNASYKNLLDDATEDTYYVLDSDPNNYIQFDTLNIETGRVAGKFMVSFDRDRSRVKKPWNPDFVRFLNGEFHCRIK